MIFFRGNLKLFVRLLLASETFEKNKQQTYDYFSHIKYSPVDVYLLKANNRNTRTRYEICSRLTTKTPE